MTFLNSILNQSKKYEFPFDHWEYSNALTEGSIEEIIQVIKSALPLGLKKIRITGGEPLIRKDISKLIKMIRDLDDELDIAMTTNGVLLRKKIQLLKQSGLDRVTVSLDSLDQQLFELQLFPFPFLIRLD